MLRYVVISCHTKRGGVQRLEGGAGGKDNVAELRT